MASAAELAVLINAKDNASKVLDSIAGKFGALGKAAAIGVAAAGVSVAAFGLKAIKSASDLEESQNKVNVVFGDSAKAVNQFAATAARALGQSRQQALAATGTFGNLFVSMGMGQKVAADMSVDIVKLASDLASFNNIRPEEALEKLRAGLVGETEPLRTLGVNLSAAAVEAKALSMGLAGNAKALTPAMKAQAAYALILEQTKTAQGDFARTSDGMANALRIIRASFSDVTSEVGGRLLPIVAPLISQFAKALPGALDVALGMFDRLTARLRGPVNYGLTLARDTALTLKQALTGQWVDDEKIRPLHRAVGILTENLRAAYFVFQDIKKGDFDAAFDRIGEVVSGLSGKAAGLGRALFTNIKTEISEIDWGEVASSVWSGIGTALSTAKDLGGKGLGLAAGLVSSLAKEVAEIDWSEVAGKIRSGIATAFTTVKDKAEKGAGMAAALLVSLKDEIAEIDWSEVAGKIRSGIATAFTTVKDKAEKGAGMVASLAMSLAEEAKTTDWSAVATAIQGGIATAMDTAGGKGTSEKTAGFLAGLRDEIQTKAAPYLEEFGVAIDKYVNPELEQWNEIIGKLDKQLKEDFQPVIAQLKDELPTFGEGLKTVGLMIAGLAAAINELAQVAAPVLGVTIPRLLITGIAGWAEWVDALSTSINIIIALVSGDFTKAWNEWAGLHERTQERIGRVLKAWGLDFDSWAETVRRILFTMRDTFTDIGGRLIDGLTAGIDGAKQKALDAVQRVADALPAWFKKLMDITSPSKVFAEFGKNIVEGLALGIAGNKDLVTDEIRALAQSTVDGWNRTLSSIKSVADYSFFEDLADELRDLTAALSAAESLGAPQWVLDMLQAGIGDAHSRAEMGRGLEQTAAVQQQRAYDAAMEMVKREQERDEALFAAWADNASNIEAIISGDAQKSIKRQIEELEKARQLMTLAGAPIEAMELVGEQLEKFRETLARYDALGSAAAAAGLVNAPFELTEAALARVRELMPTLARGGAEIADTLIAAMLKGGLSPEKLAEALGKSALPALEQFEDALTVKLAEAFLTGAGDVEELTRQLELMQQALKAAGAATSYLIDGMAVIGGGSTGGAAFGGDAASYAASLGYPGGYAVPGTGSDITGTPTTNRYGYDMSTEETGGVSQYSDPISSRRRGGINVFIDGDEVRAPLTNYMRYRLFAPGG